MLFVTPEWRRLIPTSWRIVPDAWHAMLTYLSFHIVETPGGYNALQQLSYAAVIFMLAPFSIATGEAMSPAVAARFPWYIKIFHRRQGARSLHFLALCTFIVFFIGHVPIGAGLALVIGAVINYLISPKGNPLLLFGGIALICIAIILDAIAYRGLSGGAKASAKGIGLSLACGVAVGLFYPFVAKALTGPNHLGPYTVYFVFALGAAVSNFPMNYGLMRHPVSGQALRMKDYFKGRLNLHAWGILGGIIWGSGTVANFVASYVPMIGPATSFSLGEGNTMISAIWGIFVWKEFHGAGNRVKGLLAVMFLFFVLGLSCIALAPVIH